MNIKIKKEKLIMIMGIYDDSTYNNKRIAKNSLFLCCGDHIAIPLDGTNSYDRYSKNH